MARPEVTGLVASPDVGFRRQRARRLRRLTLGALTAAIVVPVLVLAFDSATPGPAVPLPRSQGVLPDAPEQQIIASHGPGRELRLYLPIAAQHVTAIGYHAVGQGALALDPVGQQANAGLFGRLLRRIVGEDHAGIRYYLLGGELGPETAGLDIGAPDGTDVYAPVDGTVLAISERLINGKRYGVRMDIEPTGSPGLVVSVQNIVPHRALSVGSTVSASRTPIGAIVDLSDAEEAALAAFTQNSGQHVHIEVRPAVNLALQ
jgi:hypothetical protein